MFDWSLIIAFLGLFGAFVGSLSWIIWWLGSKFAEGRRFVQERTEVIRDLIVNKLEYHEQHDDKRFSEQNLAINELRLLLNNSMWELKLQNAVRGIVEKDPTTKPRKTD